ncbi:MAG: DUF423 domain-containing protein, partial [bacterium]|nr:DUF423 domain-containing protein [bacterium]
LELEVQFLVQGTMQSKTKNILVAGAVLSGLAVAIGAFGAHGLQPVLTENGSTETFKTGVLYHIFHGLGVIATGLIYHITKQKLVAISGWMFLSGVILFSGSLYMLSISSLKFFGPITPIGGVFFIIGWIMLALGIKKANT